MDVFFKGGVPHTSRMIQRNIINVEREYTDIYLTPLQARTTNHAETIDTINTIQAARAHPYV